MIPRRHFSIVRRWLPLILIGVVVAAVPTYLLTSRQSPAFEASATLLPQRLLPVGVPDFNDISVDRLVGLSSTWALIADTPQVLSAVKQALGLSEAEVELSRRVSAAVNANNALLTINAEAGSRDDAVLLANAVAAEVQRQSSQSAPNDPAVMADINALGEKILATQAEYEAVLRLPPPLTQAQQQELGDLVALLEALNSSYSALTESINRAPQGLDVLNPAMAEDVSQLAPRTLYYTLLATVVGLLAAMGLAYLLQFFDDRVRNSADLRAVTDLVSLGSVGRGRRLARRRGPARLVAIRDPHSRDADSYRRIRANIALASEGTPLGTLLVTSATTSPGKTVVAGNLAIAFAQAGQRVVLIDADLRRPSVHLLFGLSNVDGVASALGGDDASLNVVPQASGLKNLLVLTAGSTPLDPAGVLGSERFQRLLERLHSHADLLILDGAPLGVAVDATVLSAAAQGTLLVIDADRTGRAAVAAAGEELTRAKANVLGAVLYNAVGVFAPDYRGRPADGKGEPNPEVRLDSARKLEQS